MAEVFPPAVHPHQLGQERSRRLLPAGYRVGRQLVSNLPVQEVQCFFHQLALRVCICLVQFPGQFLAHFRPFFSGQLLVSLLDQCRGVHQLDCHEIQGGQHKQGLEGLEIVHALAVQEVVHQVTGAVDKLHRCPSESMVDVEEGCRQVAENTAEVVSLCLSVLAAPRAVVAGKGGSAVQAPARLGGIGKCLHSPYLPYAEQTQGAPQREGKWMVSSHGRYWMEQWCKNTKNVECLKYNTGSSIKELMIISFFRGCEYRIMGLKNDFYRYIYMFVQDYLYICSLIK